MLPQWISDLISVWPWFGAFVAAGFIILVGFKYLRPPTKGLNHFLEDWNGEPERPGVPGRPGVMVRFSNIDDFIAKYSPIIDKLDHEMHPNSGSSMADAVNRTEKKLDDHILACPAVQAQPSQTNITVTTAGPTSP